MQTKRILSGVVGLVGAFTLNLMTWGCRGPGVFFNISQASVGFDDNWLTVMGSKADIFWQLLNKLAGYLNILRFYFSVYFFTIKLCQLNTMQKNWILHQETFIVQPIFGRAYQSNQNITSQSGKSFFINVSHKVFSQKPSPFTECWLTYLNT